MEPGTRVPVVIPSHRSMLFSDEKVFTVEQCFNAQNDRVYASSSQQAATRVPRMQRSHHPALIMMWWGVSFNGTTQLYFCEEGVKTSAHVNQITVLEPIVKPLNTTMFPNQQWTFQQDSAPRTRHGQNMSGSGPTSRTSSPHLTGPLAARI